MRKRAWENLCFVCSMYNRMKIPHAKIWEPFLHIAQIISQLSGAIVFVIWFTNISYAKKINVFCPCHEKWNCALPVLEKFFDKLFQLLFILCSEGLFDHCAENVLSFHLMPLSFDCEGYWASCMQIKIFFSSRNFHWLLVDTRFTELRSPDALADSHIKPWKRRPANQ